MFSKVSVDNVHYVHQEHQDPKSNKEPSNNQMWVVTPSPTSARHDTPGEKEHEKSRKRTNHPDNFVDTGSEGCHDDRYQEPDSSHRESKLFSFSDGGVPGVPGYFVNKTVQSTTTYRVPSFMRIWMPVGTCMDSIDKRTRASY